ncbi:MAG: 30S ribosome-binding factor RbfA [Betaproteobacteria bacterium]|nr:30S ribosome-binding factor RbfA [Betaproteobacteria bacterium]
MAWRSGRARKVADQVQRELSVILARELRDPRLGMVTLTAVDMSPDCSRAVVHFTCLEETRAAGASEALARASGLLRSQLAQRLKIYSAPTLRFAYDESVARGDRLSRLIDSVVPRKG